MAYRKILVKFAVKNRQLRVRKEVDIDYTKGDSNQNKQIITDKQLHVIYMYHSRIINTINY